MGDPKRIRKKYSGPRHPWQKDRIDEEKKLLKEYGLKNKTELWKVSSKMKNFSDQAKKLIAAKGTQAEKERKQLMEKLNKLGFIQKNANLDDVLGLKLRDFLNRRLQTLVFKKGMARSVNQARQFITHEHIVIGEKKITSPSYLVSVEEEPRINFLQGSSISYSDHPTRVVNENETQQR